MLQAPYLGMRERSSTGKPGPYQWMTYAEVISKRMCICFAWSLDTGITISFEQLMTVQAAEARTAIGSGLLYHGLERGSKIGLYSVNCRGDPYLKLCPWVI